MRLWARSFPHPHLPLVVLLLASSATALDNGRALTPPAGWTAWNTYVFHPTQQRIEASMRAMAKLRGPQQQSLVDLGYVQANLDDSWQACGAGVNKSFHDAAGNPLVNLRSFPYVHKHLPSLAQPPLSVQPDPSRQLHWSTNLRLPCSPHVRVVRLAGTSAP